MPIKKIRVGTRLLKIKDCKGLSSARGLMFSDLKEIDGALIYANNIWMPFCKPLDLYFLDENFIVLQKQSAISMTANPKTWKIYRNEKAKYCLELKRGAANIKIGKKIELR